MPEKSPLGLSTAKKSAMARTSNGVEILNAGSIPNVITSRSKKLTLKEPDILERIFENWG